MARFLCFAFLFLALATVALANQRPTPPPPTRAPTTTTRKAPPPTTTKAPLAPLYKLTVSGATGCARNLNLVCQASNQFMFGLKDVLKTSYHNGNNNVVSIVLQEQALNWIAYPAHLTAQRP